jgi:uncharacterized protein YukE
MAELAVQDAPAWSQFVRDFDGAYKSFMENRNALLMLGPYIQAKHPELQAQWADMLDRANALLPKLQALADTRARVTSWLGALGTVYQSAIDMTSRAIEGVANAVSAARRSLGLGGLGVVPVVVVVIGVAAAGVTLAAITKWVADAYLFSRRLNTLQELEARGLTPVDAANAVNKVLGQPNAPGGIERTLSQILWIVAAVGLGLVVLPRLLSPPPSRSTR